MSYDQTWKDREDVLDRIMKLFSKMLSRYEPPTNDEIETLRRAVHAELIGFESRLTASKDDFDKGAFYEGL